MQEVWTATMRRADGQGEVTATITREQGDMDAEFKQRVKAATKALEKLAGIDSQVR
jgi:hypothetical protein